MRALRIARAEGGYTLAEMLVTSAVIALVMAGLFSLLSTGAQTWVVGTNRSEAQQNGRLVLQRLAEEVRNGGWDPRNTQSFAVIQALAPPQNGFTISNDWSADGLIQTNVATNVNGTNRGELITYDVVNNSLRRQESQVDNAAVEVTEISSITFTYRNADDAVVANPHVAANALGIRTVDITVVTAPDTQSSSNAQRVSVTSTLRARVRNR